MKIKKALVVVLLIMLGLVGLYVGEMYLASRILSFPIVCHEVQRVMSPDGRVDAVLVTADRGAMSTTTYWVYVLPSGMVVEKDIAKSKHFEPVFQGGRLLSSVSLTWEKPLLLRIEHASKHVYGFRNKLCPFEDETSYVVNIEEIGFMQD